MGSQGSTGECSPFRIPHEQVEALEGSQGFQVLRNYLSNQASFCSHHSRDTELAQETWLLQRDILHALTMPIVELYNRASALAEAALCATRPEDLELAFSGEARGAFLWLQCFLGEEPDWCQTRGCPACVTIETLSTESHVRLAIAASLLSTASVGSNRTLSNAPSLPPLHVLPALRDALDRDSFWGPEYWAYLFSRASQLCTGIQALMTSCVDLESLVSSPTTKEPSTGQSLRMPGLLFAATTKGEAKGARLKKSKLAKRQLRMKVEEVEMMRRSALQCWAKAFVHIRTRNELLGRAERRRSLTCP